MTGARQAVAFLTPLGGAATPSSASPAWFPLVGGAIGGVLGLVWWGARQIWPPGVAAAVVVTADLALTGLLHLDGLADSADGLLPHLSRERRLAVMQEPDVGAFGVGVAGAALLLRWSALAAIAPSPLLLAGLWCGSRTLMAAVMVKIPYARDEGLASAFLGGRVWPLVLGAIAAVALARVAAAGLLAGLAVLALARRRIGGFTGDVLGAVGMVGETVGLLVAAA